jgi:hypothetical protein
MNRLRGFFILAISISLATSVMAQNRQGRWLYRNMVDTTIVRCWNDTLCTMHFPPGCIGMMYPESMYCRMDILPLDSLHHPYDSTFIGWCRIMMGQDSMHFNIMNCDSMNINHMMQFQRSLRCRLHWDSLRCDSTRRHWRPTGVQGWNGSNWVTISGVTWEGNTALFVATQLYSAFAFVGTPSGPTGVAEEQLNPVSFALAQNYPNPFNPSTTIGFSISEPSVVNISVFNPLGQRVRLLVSKLVAAGTHLAVWDGKNDVHQSLVSGVYFYQLTAVPTSGKKVFMQSKKMILMK